MKARLAAAVVPVLLSVAGAGHAQAVRIGANHRVGDDGFVAAHHRAFGAGDGEAERMHAHLTYIRARLGAQPATRPELAAKRAELLGYLDEYIAKGVTPKNAHLPWRTPVFIDDDGAICAVGYLLERSVGRAVPETIARAHRYAYLEEIAAAIPDVRDWIAASGFSLEELASIQPGYAAPVASTWGPWNLATDRLPDGPYAASGDDGETTGAIAHGQMVGAWTRRNADKRLVGKGTFVAGRGTWTSLYEDGKTMAEGPFVASEPDGAWRFYHRSGNLAAEGPFVHGVRAGAWRFFYDTKAETPIAEGSFRGRAIAGPWRHYDANGRLLATSDDVSSSAWRGGFGHYLLDIVPGADHVHHWVHQGDIQGDHHRLDLVSDGSEPIFVKFETGEGYDADGHKLTRREGGAAGWVSSDCHWNRTRKRLAHAFDLVTLHGLTSHDRYRDSDESCDAPQPVAASRAKHLDAMFASIVAVRARSPEFVRKLALGESSDPAEVGKVADLGNVLASTMTWYVEWPHVDGRFLAVFATLPGYGIRTDGAS
jgi:hypothetical protein